MKEKLLIALSHTLKGYLTEPNATRLIQKTMSTLEQQLHARYIYIALQNKKTSYLDITHSHGVSRSALNEFHKKIGSNSIGRIFFKDSFSVIKKSDNLDDYEEMRIDDDYAMCVAAHIGWEGRTHGFLACYFDHEFEIDLATRNFFLSMAGACSAALEKEELLNLISELRQFDVETGIYSHQYFIGRLEKEMHDTQFESHALSLAILDMDNFKSIINLYGEEAAREVLKQSAEVLKSLIRGCDVLGTHGIDEFILYMPDTDATKAEKTINDFNAYLDKIAFTANNIKTSFSCGVTQLRENEDDLEELIQRAQLALYNARKSAQHTVVIEI
ncbi:MAG: GGDEF domain-containing protein [Candidatus Riflebacteria bacterium]|nr:GGDEF domain-containing protein [Candidatus Riflebacteria bacterium]